MHADHGDSVKKGVLLARLDSSEQEARVDQARAAVTQAEATVEQAMANVERAEALLKEKMLTNERRRELSQPARFAMPNSLGGHPLGWKP